MLLVMGTSKRAGTGRVAKRQRRLARKDKQAARDYAGDDFLPTMAFIGPAESPLDYPDAALLDTARCRLEQVCAGCGATSELRVVTSAFSGPRGGFDVGCATLCGSCDGQSFLHLLTDTQFEAAFNRHARHQSGGLNPQLLLYKGCGDIGAAGTADTDPHP